jgi:hypothetical protein
MITKDEYSIVIGNPRMGTSYVSNYNQFTWRQKVNAVQFTQTELFNHIPPQTFELLRSQSYEIYVKVMCKDILDHWDWFRFFYRNNTMILVRRRNLWNALVSYIFHLTISEQHNYWQWHSTKSEGLSPLYPFTHDDLKAKADATNFSTVDWRNHLEYYLHWVRFFEKNVRPWEWAKKIEVDLEDYIDEEKIKNLFDLTEEQWKLFGKNIKPFELDYTKYLPFLSDLRNEYKTRQNEFVFYGYDEVI